MNQGDNAMKSSKRIAAGALAVATTLAFGAARADAGDPPSYRAESAMADEVDAGVRMKLTIYDFLVTSV
jgi:hypothetical protein